MALTLPRDPLSGKELRFRYPIISSFTASRCLHVRCDEHEQVFPSGVRATITIWEVLPDALSHISCTSQNPWPVFISPLPITADVLTIADTPSKKFIII